MKASQIQQVIKSQADVLTKLYSEYRTLRTSRAAYNAEADKAAAKGNDEHAELYLFQAEVFSPYIRKMKVKIAKLEEAQKALKGLLGHAQAMESLDESLGAYQTDAMKAAPHWLTNTDDTITLDSIRQHRVEQWQGSGEDYLAKLGD